MAVRKCTLEDLVMNREFWEGKKVFITGHTGFKGAWLSLWLNSLGHEVSGISLDPIPNSLFDRANVSESIENDFRIDIRRSDEVKSALLQVKPYFFR